MVKSQPFLLVNFFRYIYIDKYSIIPTIYVPIKISTKSLATQGLHNQDLNLSHQQDSTATKQPHPQARLQLPCSRAEYGPYGPAAETNGTYGDLLTCFV